jgi:hypothetical protein
VNAHYDNARKLEAEIEQVHALIDHLSGPPRKVETENVYAQRDLTIMTRIAGYLATRT